MISSPTVITSKFCCSGASSGKQFVKLGCLHCTRRSPFWTRQLHSNSPRVNFQFHTSTWRIGLRTVCVIRFGLSVSQLLPEMFSICPMSKALCFLLWLWEPTWVPSPREASQWLIMQRPHQLSSWQPSPGNESPQPVRWPPGHSGVTWSLCPEYPLSSWSRFVSISTLSVCCSVFCAFSSLD